MRRLLVYAAPKISAPPVSFSAVICPGVPARSVLKISLQPVQPDFSVPCVVIAHKTHRLAQQAVLRINPRVFGIKINSRQSHDLIWPAPGR